MRLSPRSSRYSSQNNDAPGPPRAGRQVERRRVGGARAHQHAECVHIPINRRRPGGHAHRTQQRASRGFAHLQAPHISSRRCPDTGRAPQRTDGCAAHRPDLIAHPVNIGPSLGPKRSTMACARCFDSRTGRQPLSASTGRRDVPPRKRADRSGRRRPREAAPRQPGDARRQRRVGISAMRRRAMHLEDRLPRRADAVTTEIRTEPPS